MRKAGAALLLAPEPLTNIPGAFLLAASYLVKKRDPASLKALSAESRRLVREIQSLRF